MPHRGLETLALLLLAGCGLRSGGPRLALFAPDAEHPTGRVELHDVDVPPDDLRVRVAAAPPGAPDVLGEVRVEGGIAAFVPRFPLQPGLTYRLSSDGEPPLALEFTLPAPSLEPRVDAPVVSPAGPELPSNLLRFYLHFAEPMRRGEAYRRTRILDGSGAVVAGAFLEIEPELWNPACTRLTLLVDPGRIKRGLVPHEELGPVLHPARDYVLEVDAAWRDARGAPLRAGLRHAFFTAGPDGRSPDPARWKITTPRAGTREPLAVRFDEVLDSALVLRLLAVEGPRGAPVAGRGRVDEDQAGWSFVPGEAWRAAPHALVVPAVLEDLAGNSVGRPFEVEGASSLDSVLEDETRRLPFAPR